MGAVFSILGQGVVVAGTVRAGILKVGMRLQVERGAVGAIPGLAVEVRKIIPHVPHSTELYRGQYAKEVAEAGPGVQLGVSVAGTSQKDLKAGDLLFA